MMKISELHKNEKAQETILESVQSWYEWCIKNAPHTVEASKVIEAKIGHISSKNASVQFLIEDRNGVNFNVYITPEPFFIKGHMKGKTYRFKKDFMKSIHSSKVELV